VLLSDGPVDAAELTGEPVPVAWRRQALLWMSQLDAEDARRLWQSLRVEWDLTGESTRLLVRAEDGADVGVITSLPWPADERPAPGPPSWDQAVPAESEAGKGLRKSAFVQTSFDNRELIYVMIPFWRRFGDLTHPRSAAKWESDARALLELLLAGPGDEERLAFFTASLGGADSAVWDFLDGHLYGRTDRERLRQHLAEYRFEPEG
jgi:hypothetical protein